MISVLEVKDFSTVKQKEEIFRKQYEKKKLVYLLTLPIMWLIVGWVFLKKLVLGFFGKKPKTNFLFFDGLSPTLRRIKEGAASWQALDLIYNYHTHRKNLKGVEKILSDFWVNMINAQAVRNRKLLVVEKLARLIREVYYENNHEEVKIFSIASGSAQAVFEAIEKARLPVKVCLLDLDQRALDYSLNLVRKMELEDLISISTIRGIATNCEKEIKAFRPHIIEMVGFMDYRPHKKVIKLVQKIYQVIPSGGYFFTANICPNAEKWFLKWVINWPMIYRKPNLLVEILEVGGFQNPTIYLEPQGLHCIAVCRKN